jgi:mRNA interferase HigB
MEVRWRKRILEFIDRGDAKARKLLPAWLDDVERAKWKTPSDIRQRHRTADFLPGIRVIFNVGGNDYRIVTVIDYTRRDYDRIDAATI